jgi:hypothetical protein
MIFFVAFLVASVASTAQSQTLNALMADSDGVIVLPDNIDWASSGVMPSVFTDATLTGDGTAGDVLSVASPFPGFTGLVEDYGFDPADKADKVAGATLGNFAGLDAGGNLTDSGSKAGDFLTGVDWGDIGGTLRSEERRVGKEC